MVVSATLQRFLATCEKLGHAQGIQLRWRPVKNHRDIRHQVIDRQVFGKG